MRPGSRTNGWRPARPRARQRGYTLLVASGVVALMAAVVAGGQWVRGVAQAEGLDVTRIDTIDVANRMLTTYASLHGRLPCPASQRGGAEDCKDTGQKGWFPLDTLVASGADADAFASMRQLRYLVQRNAVDLTTPDTSRRSNMGKQHWVPEAYSGSADFCGKLVLKDTASGSILGKESLMLAQPRAGADEAFVRIPGKDIQVAYALAPAWRGVSAEDSLGSQPGFELSAQATTGIAQDEVAGMGAYGQQVSFTDLHSLGESLQCSSLYRSYAAVRDGWADTEGVAQSRQQNIDFTGRDLSQGVQAVLAGTVMVTVDGMDVGLGILKTLSMMSEPEKVAMVVPHIVGIGVEAPGKVANVVRLGNDTYAMADAAITIDRSKAHQVWLGSQPYAQAIYAQGAAFNREDIR